MTTYVSDKEQIEMIKEWWRQNGTFTIVAIVIAVSLSFGWRYWQNKQEQDAANASVVYEQMLTHEANHQLSDAELDATSLIADHPKTPYATLGAFISALNSVNANNYPAAIERYNWVIANSKSKDFKQIAKIRKARILASRHQNDEALAELNQIENETYLPLINELKGDIYLAKNDKAKAKTAYQNALTALRKDVPNRNFLQIKYDQLN